MPDEKAVARLLEAIGYRFTRFDLLRDALTHRSFANEHPARAPHDNERLEFLGDAVVGFIVAALLFERFPDAPEGELTRRRADLVCESGLAEVALAIDLAPALRLGKGEEKSGGRDKPRLLSSALEAVIGAVYLDGGSDAVSALGERLFRPRLVHDEAGERDSKSRLQELVQARSGQIPHYELLHSAGPDHDRRFFVSIQVDGEELAQGDGRSKLAAEQEAARLVVESIEAEESPREGALGSEDEGT